MAKSVSGYEPMDEGEVTQSEAKDVFLNVISTLGIMLFTGMIVVAVIFFNECPTQPYLAIYMIVQGSVSITMPILFLVKYRLGVGIKRLNFLTYVVTVAVLSFGWFCAGTYWLMTAGCPSTFLYRSAIGFLVPVWIIAIMCIITFTWACCRKQE
ncbi:uncharacterized protein [Haliotis cracherodii]|uniref:uncharacterized protein n=1 Tax=Haliotis cracherodii TaxID=6455 RepID=UPI0039E91B3C